MLSSDADVSVFDAGDVYTAGLNYRLVPIMAEIYNLGVPEYYAVAVAKEEDPSTEITYLRGAHLLFNFIFTVLNSVCFIIILVNEMKYVITGVKQLMYRINYL